MWSEVWSTTCSFMQERWFYFHLPQPDPKYHCQTVKRSMQRYLCSGSSTTTNWWNSSIINFHWKRNSCRYLHKRFLVNRSYGILFDVRFFNPNTKRYFNQDISKTYKLFEFYPLNEIAESWLVYSNSQSPNPESPNHVSWPR